MTGLRIGHGYDVHRLTEGRRLILGGVEVPYEKGLLGHSDADVLTHAVMDALLGAAALGDIGKLFPDTDAAYAGISSICGCVRRDMPSSTLMRRFWRRLRSSRPTVSGCGKTLPVRFHLTLPASASRRRPRRDSALPERDLASRRTRSRCLRK